MSGETVGFLGTGIMGGPMAGHLLAAGYRVQAWNRSAEKLTSLVAAGATPQSSPAAAATGARTLVSMLNDGPSTDAVLFDQGKAVQALAPGATVIVMSSIPVETAIAQAERCAKLGIRYIDAPVSGGQRGAREASLAIMAGGEAETYSMSAPLLSALGRPVHVGPAGAGQQTKLANQLIVAITIAAVSEAFLFAERGGVDPAKVREALAGGFADSTIMRQHGLRMILEDFAPGGVSVHQLKDTRTALARAKALGVDLPVLRQVDALFAALVEHGDGGLDHSALIRELRRHNGLPAARGVGSKSTVV